MNKTGKIVLGVVIIVAVIGVGIYFAKAAPPSPTPTPAPVPVAQEKSFTMAEIAPHNSKDSCYTTVNGSVYDLTPFISMHPGGVANIMKICGIDGTAMFTAQHEGQRRPANELEKLKIGILAK